MNTSKKRALFLLGLIFIFFAIIFVVLLAYRLSQNVSTIGNPNAAISCSYCDKAYNKDACYLNCNAINETNAGKTCPSGTTAITITRNDQTRFTGCKPNGANIGVGVGTGERCNALIPTIAGFTKSYYGYCMYEPVENCRWWNPAKGGVNNAAAWEDCGCGPSSDAAVLSKCNASNAGKEISFTCQNCGQDAAAVCPGVFDPATSRSFKGVIQCTDNGVLKPVSNVQVQVKNAAGTVIDTKSTGTDGVFNLIAPNEATSNVTYSVNVSSTNASSPILTLAKISAVGFTAATASGCTPGASNDANSSTYCNTKCTSGSSGAFYDQCAAGTGASIGYNFIVGECNTPAPTYTCYSCDKNTWTITSSTGTTKCDETNNFAISTDPKLVALCKPASLTCYKCSGGVVSESTVTQTNANPITCPTGTSTTRPASCTITCNQCQDQNGSSVNVSKVYNDITTCPTSWFQDPQACKNTCYYCDKTTDSNNWTVKSKVNTNAVCDNAKGEYSTASAVTSCVTPKNTCYYCDKTTDANNWTVKSKEVVNTACDVNKGEYTTATAVTSCVSSKPILTVSKTGVATCETDMKYSNLLYTITIVNTGKVSGNTGEIVDTIDSKLSSVDITDISNSGKRTGNTITWSAMSVSPGATIKLTYKLRVKATESSTAYSNKVSLKVAETSEVLVSDVSVNVICKTNLPTTSVSTDDKVYITTLFAALILLLGVLGYKFNFANFAANYRGRKVGTKKFEEEFTKTIE